MWISRKSIHLHNNRHKTTRIKSSYAKCTQGNCLIEVPAKEPSQDLLAGGKALTRSYCCGLIE